MESNKVIELADWRGVPWLKELVLDAAENPDLIHVQIIDKVAHVTLLVKVDVP